MKLALVLPLALAGCALFSSGSKVPSDLDATATCVVNQIEQGNTQLATLTAACLPDAEQTIADIVAALLDSQSFTSSHPAAASTLKGELQLRASASAKP